MTRGQRPSTATAGVVTAHGVYSDAKHPAGELLKSSARTCRSR
jgi:hypothetical protein